MNAIEFLKHEHDKVRKMLDDISDDSHREETKRKKFDALCHDLIRHETMEETIWYPSFKHNEKVDDTIKHLISEEKDAEKAIKKFENVQSFEEWEEKFVKFKKDVEHHANEEEEKLFPKVEKILTDEELKLLGIKMQEFKEQYK